MIFRGNAPLRAGPRASPAVHLSSITPAAVALAALGERPALIRPAMKSHIDNGLDLRIAAVPTDAKYRNVPSSGGVDAVDLRD